VHGFTVEPQFYSKSRNKESYTAPRKTEQAANNTANTNVKPLIFNTSAEAIGDFDISVHVPPHLQ
jgi:hypothetical protein